MNCEKKELKVLSAFTIRIDTKKALSGADPHEIYFTRGDGTTFEEDASIADDTKSEVDITAVLNTSAGAGWWKAESRYTLGGKSYTGNTAKFEVKANFK